MNDEIKNVADIIDIKYLQHIQDGLGKVMGITTVILDPVGIPITAATNSYAFCKAMSESEGGMKMCINANATLAEKNVSTRKTAVLTCPNSGLKTAAVPIFLKDKYLGSWLIGQIKMENIDFSLIEKTAYKAGISHEESRKNIDMLPVIAQEEFDDILIFLETITSTLIDMVNMNFELNIKNASLIESSKKLDISIQTFKDFINHTDLGAYLVDFNTGELIMHNDVYRKLLNLPANDTEEHICRVHMEENDVFALCPRHRLVDEAENPTGPYIWEHYNQATSRWLSLTSRALIWMDGRLAVMTTFVDITQRKEEEAHIAYLAYNDVRLAVPNGVKLRLDLAVPSNLPAYMICLNVQGLRKINEVYSRGTGDNLLKSIVAYFRNIDGYEEVCLYRIDGDDFVFLARNYAEKDVMDLAQRIYDRFDFSWTVHIGDLSQKMYVGAHMGVIPVSKLFASQDTLINTIETTLSFARKESRLILFDDKIDNEFKNHLKFELSLKTCVLNGMQGFFLNYQPIICVKANKWKGIEVLCRWNSPEMGNIPPNIFIAKAEQLGLINIIGDWVLEEALKQVKAWKLDKLPDFELNVNLSPLQLRDAELPQKVAALIEKYQYPAEKLTLEITESSEVQFENKTVSVLGRLKDAGILLSLDDFGVGYATIYNLKNLPVNTLKTDRTFVMEIEKDRFSQHTVKMIIEFAHSLNLSVVAEGVETLAQKDIVTAMGVNMIQGYYYSKPLSADDLYKNISKFKKFNEVIKRIE